MGIKAAPPIYIGTCALCQCEHVGIYYVIDTFSREPMWVCSVCEKIEARERRHPPRQTVTSRD